MITEGEHSRLISSFGHIVQLKRMMLQKYNSCLFLFSILSSVLPSYLHSFCCFFLAIATMTKILKIAFSFSIINYTSIQINVYFNIISAVNCYRTIMKHKNIFLCFGSIKAVLRVTPGFALKAQFRWFLGNHMVCRRYQVICNQGKCSHLLFYSSDPRT